MVCREGGQIGTLPVCFALLAGLGSLEIIVVLPWSAVRAGGQISARGLFEFGGELGTAGRSTCSRVTSDVGQHFLVICRPRIAQQLGPFHRRNVDLHTTGIGDQLAADESTMCACGGPGPILCIGNNPRTYGIEFDVANRGPEMCRVKRARVESPLPQTPAQLLRPVDVLSVAEVDRLEGAGQRLGSLGHDDEMDMIAHQAVGLDSQPMLLGVLAEQLQIAEPIKITEEDILAAITTLSNMVCTTWYDHPGHSWHDTTIRH